MALKSVPEASSGTGTSQLCARKMVVNVPSRLSWCPASVLSVHRALKVTMMHGHNGHNDGGGELSVPRYISSTRAKLEGEAEAISRWEKTEGWEEANKEEEEEKKTACRKGMK